MYTFIRRWWFRNTWFIDVFNTIWKFEWNHILIAAAFVASPDSSLSCGNSATHCIWSNWNSPNLPPRHLELSDKCSHLQYQGHDFQALPFLHPYISKRQGAYYTTHRHFGPIQLSFYMRSMVASALLSNLYGGYKVNYRCWLIFINYRWNVTATVKMNHICELITTFTSYVRIAPDPY